MKVCFTAAYEGRFKFKEQYKTIIGYLKSLDPLLEEWVWKEKMSETKNDYEDVYKSKINRIKRADVLVAEISHPSIGVGFEIFYALSEKKQVLALYLEEAKNQASETIRGVASRYLTVKSYNLENLPKLLGDYFKYVSKKLEVKFNCILPPKLDSYLKEKAERKHTTKSAIVRSLIEKEMKQEANSR